MGHIKMLLHASSHKLPKYNYGGRGYVWNNFQVRHNFILSKRMLDKMN